MTNEKKTIIPISDVQNKLTNWIKSNAIAISFILILIGGCLIFASNKFDISSRTVSSVLDGKITQTVIYTLDKSKPVIDITANVLLSLGVALFISAFFIRYIEGGERKQFEDKLLKFQENTAKDAIQSVFKTIIDTEFFDLIKKSYLMLRQFEKTRIGNTTFLKLKMEKCCC